MLMVSGQFLVQRMLVQPVRLPNAAFQHIACHGRFEIAFWNGNGHLRRPVAALGGRLHRKPYDPQRIGDVGIAFLEKLPDGLLALQSLSPDKSVGNDLVCFFQC